jgi:hypothetical protein
MWLLGEVLNNGDFAVAGLQVQIDLVGPEGSALMSVPAWVAAGVVRPGERGPFAVLVREPPAEDVQPVVVVSRGDSLVEAGTYYLDLAVTDSEVTIDDGQTNVTGTVENSGEETVGSITVVATFYGSAANGSAGRVSGYGQQILEGPLAPGESLPFELGGAPPGGQTVDVVLTVYGRK